MAGGQISGVLRYLRRIAGGPPAGAESDRQLLERFAQQRDESAFAALLDRHAAMVLGVCRRILGAEHAADDAFQAVFLVLAQKSAAVRWEESIGGWLHEVADRVARKARAADQRRRWHERQASTMASSHACSDARPAELHEVLDEELRRLPAKYRTPMVLCYLEGKSNEEAGKLLGWPTGTVSGRLARAREILRQRLGKRGLALSTASWAALLETAGVAPAVPPALLSTTLQAAVAVSMGPGLAAGIASTEAISLAQGVLHAMFLTKIKIAAVVVLTVGLLTTGIGLFTFHGRANPLPADPNAAGAKKPEAAEAKAVDGLKLVLSASKKEIALNADPTKVEPLTLSLAFTNVTDKPIKIDAYDLVWSTLAIAVTGPNPKSVRVTDRRRMIERDLAAPTEAHYPTIEPGKRWSLEGLSFPGMVGGITYELLEPGDYRIRVSYVHPNPPSEFYGGKKFGVGAWQGTVHSNEIVLRVKPGGVLFDGNTPRK